MLAIDYFFINADSVPMSHSELENILSSLMNGWKNMSGGSDIEKAMKEKRLRVTVHDMRCRPGPPAESR